MSRYTVVVEVGRKLREVLWESFRVDDQVLPIVGSAASLVLSDPTRRPTGVAPRLSLWLYRVTENEFLKNAPPMPVPRAGGPPGAQSYRRPGVPLELQFLVTPMTNDPENDLLLLGKTIQVLHDNAQIPLNEPGSGVSETLGVSLASMALGEVSEVWQALREPYRLSVCYQVNTVTIDAEVTQPVVPVKQRELTPLMRQTVGQAGVSP